MILNKRTRGLKVDSKKSVVQMFTSHFYCCNSTPLYLLRKNNFNLKFRKKFLFNLISLLSEI